MADQQVPTAGICMGSGRGTDWASYLHVEQDFARHYGRYVALGHPEQPRLNARGEIALPNEETPVSADFLRSMVEQGLVGRRLNVTFVPQTDTFTRNRWDDTARQFGFGSGYRISGLANQTRGIFVPDDVEAGVLFHETVHGWTHDAFYAWTTRGTRTVTVGVVAYPLGRLFLEPATEFLTMMAGYGCGTRSAYQDGADWIRQKGLSVELIARAMFTGDCAVLERELLRVSGKSNVDDVFGGLGNVMNGRSFDDGGATP